MTFNISNQTRLGKVVIKVEDLEKMTNYYTEVIGLDIINEDERKVDLGIAADESVLLRLELLDQPAPKKTTTGLYHIAFLLPSRKDLGNVVKQHFQQNQYGITGASNHGYSEAIYLYDPELNGIEIYRDKDKEEWDIREDGSIEGITERMDFEAVYAAADAEPAEKFPSGTVVGHVHLQVADLDHSRQFFGDVLGMGLKSEYDGKALFYAAGDYHHHIGNNVWTTQGRAAADPHAPGLDYFEIIIPQLDELKSHLKEIDYDFQELSPTEITLNHPDGIQVRILEK